jgi:hypothetical protein
MLIDLEHPILCALIVVPQGPACSGFRTLRDHGRLDLSVEDMVVDEHWDPITRDFPDLKVAAQWWLDHPDWQG